MKYIYLFNINGTDIYKIGFTKSNPKKRLKELQTGNPFRILLIDSFQSDIAPQIESVLHRLKFYKKYTPEDGNTLLGEWFNLTNDDVRDFQAECVKIEKNLKLLENNSAF